MLLQYNRFVKTSYDEFIKPTMKYADIIIPHGRSNTVAIDFVLQNLKTRIDESDFKPEQIQTVDLMKSGSQKQEVVYPVESQSALVDALFDKLNAKEGGPLDNLYKQTLLSMLAALTDIGKFKDECMLFIVDATSASGQQSIHDFVLHSREQTHLTIFTFISTELSIPKSLNKTISVYALRKAGQVDVECS